MKRTWVLIVLAAAFALLLSAGWAKAQSPLPQPTGYVNDFAGVIDSATKDRLETTLGNLDRQQQIQFSVVTVDTTGGQEIFDYSLAVARGWGVGAKDATKPSLLLLVAIKDRKYYTQVSRHLEGDLPDGLVGQIQREQLVPAFKAGKYGQGLADTINTYIATVASKNGFSTDTIFPSGTAPPVRVLREKKNPLGFLGIALVIGAVIVVFLIASRGRGGRGGGSGWLGWLLVSALMNSGRGSSGWSGGGFGGSGGGSSDSGGGFGGFGGGGDFGGGGAGGSW